MNIKNESFKIATGAIFLVLILCLPALAESDLSQMSQTPNDQGGVDYKPVGNVNLTNLNLGPSDNLFVADGNTITIGSPIVPNTTGPNPIFIYKDSQPLPGLMLGPSGSIPIPPADIVLSQNGSNGLPATIPQTPNELGGKDFRPISDLNLPQLQLGPNDRLIMPDDKTLTIGSPLPDALVQATQVNGSAPMLSSGPASVAAIMNVESIRSATTVTQDVDGKILFN